MVDEAADQSRSRATPDGTGPAPRPGATPCCGPRSRWPPSGGRRASRTGRSPSGPALPLATASYFFSSIDDLVAEALRTFVADEAQPTVRPGRRARRRRPHPRRDGGRPGRGRHARVGPLPWTLAQFETYLQAARGESLQEPVAEALAVYEQVAEAALTAAGAPDADAAAPAFNALADGFALHHLARPRPDDVAALRRALRLLFVGLLVEAGRARPGGGPGHGHPTGRAVRGTSGATMAACGWSRAIPASTMPWRSCVAAGLPGFGPAAVVAGPATCRRAPVAQRRGAGGPARASTCRSARRQRTRSTARRSPAGPVVARRRRARRVGLPPAGPQGSPSDGGVLVRGDVVATGPLTELARALLGGNHRSTGWCGWAGRSECAHDVDAIGAEFNAAADPPAVDEVLAAPAAVRHRPDRGDAAGDVRARRPDAVAGRAAGRPLCADLVERRIAAGTSREPRRSTIPSRCGRGRARPVPLGGPPPRAAGPDGSSWCPIPMRRSSAVAVAVDADAARDRGSCPSSPDIPG